MKVLYFDCFSGASGDMICGALIDAGADFNAMKDALLTLGVQGFAPTAEKVKKKGTMATQFKVNIDASHGHPHRHLRHIVEIIEKGNLPDPVKKASLETFRRIAVAEAEVHGSTPEKIHFHEVGAVDSIVDIVGAHLALHQIKPDRIFASPLHVGSGTVKCAHGIMPVPAPATALLIKGIPSYGGSVDGELLTPTGAALIAQLAEGYRAMPAMTIDSTGYGSGEKDVPDRPNVLRVLIGEMTESPARKNTETITVIETNVDDLNPQMVPAVIEDALTAGARDAFVAPITGKKGRPGLVLTVLCDPGKAAALVQVLFRGTTTLGVRMRNEERICMDREWKHVDTKHGRVRIKIGSLNGQRMNAAPEYDDCAKCAHANGVSVLEVYQAAMAAAVKGEFIDG